MTTEQNTEAVAGEIVEYKISPELTKALADVDIAPDTRASLVQTFQPLFNDIRELAERGLKITVTDASQLREMKAARETRLALVKARGQAEKTRKELKADLLARGKAIDNVASVVKDLSGEVETHLQAQEDFAKIAEAKRLEALVESRMEALRERGIAPGPYRLEDMTEEEFEGLLSTLDAARRAKEEDERRHKLFTVRSRALRDAGVDDVPSDLGDMTEHQFDELLTKEQERLAAEKAEREAAAKAAREEAARLEAEREKARADAEAKAEKERKARLAAERQAKAAKAQADKLAKEAQEAKEKAAAAAKAEADRIAAEEAKAAEAARKAASAPDREKLRAMSARFASIERPTFTNRTLAERVDKAVIAFLNSLDDLEAILD